MTDPNEFELAAMASASDRAGEYIESIGQTDMAQWSADQWHGLIEAICGGYVESLLEQKARAIEAVGKIET